MLVYAILSLAAGLAIILGHNVWSGGTLSVIVTLVGWLIFAKGLVLMLVTPETLTPFLERMQQHYHYPVYVVPTLIIGLYLTYAGFTATSKQS
jgi:ABC-type xylose transport system permease subunit